MVTVVWTKATEGDLRTLDQVGRERDVRLLPSQAKAFELRIVEARARGAVVALAADDNEAGRAFRAGADEVLRFGESTPERLAPAIERAELAASARLSRASGGAAVDLEPTAFSLLMRALCRQIGDSLTNAWTQYESIAQQLKDVRELQGKLAEWAALAAPAQELRRLHGRASLLFPGEVGKMLETASGSLRRAELALESAQLLSSTESDSSVDVSLVLEELVELLRQEVSSWAALRVRVQGPCVARVPVTFLVCLVTSLIAGIVDVFRAESQWDGRIEIRPALVDGILVLEVHDNGPALVADLDSFALDSPTRGGQLARIRDRVRAAGSEMLVEAGEAGTTVRVYLNPDEPSTPLTLGPALSVVPGPSVERRPQRRKD